MGASLLPFYYRFPRLGVTIDFLRKDYLSYSTSTIGQTDTTGTSEIHACAKRRTVLLPEQGRNHVD